MPPSRSDLSSHAIGWALLSQVFWVPLVAIDLHDRWVAHQRDITPPGQALPHSPIARARPFSLNDLLGAARPVQQLASQAGQSVSGAVGQAVSGAGVLLSSAGSGVSSLLDRPFSASVDAPASGAPAPFAETTLSAASSFAAPGPGLLGRSFTRAQLLGGGMGLADLNERPMPALALVERSITASSGDPLAPLPSLWREPMRQALQSLPGAPQQLLGTARLVVLPSSRVSQPTDVPLALQSDGSIDVLQAPADPAVLGEIESWSRRQSAPAGGSLVPALVRLHPLPADVQLAPSPAAAPAARAALARPEVSLPPLGRTSASQSGGGVSNPASRAQGRQAAMPSRSSVPGAAIAPAASRAAVSLPSIPPPAAAPAPAREPAAPSVPVEASSSAGKAAPAPAPAAQEPPAAAAPADQAAFVLTPPPPVPGPVAAVPAAAGDIVTP